MKIVKTTASFLVLTFSCQPAFGQDFNVVSDEQVGKNGSLWGQQSSKACSLDGDRFYVSSSTTGREGHARLFKWGAQEWRMVWEGDTNDVKQNPSIVCDTTGKAVHILYNTIDRDLIHYRVPAPYDETVLPVKIGTDNLADGVDYMAAGISPVSSHIYVASSNGPRGVADKYNLFYYHDGPKQWYGPFSQTIAHEVGTGWIDTRSDGRYLYSVITAYRDRVFSAADFLANDSAVNSGGRKHWAFWESPSYGKDKHPPIFNDGESGVNQAYETATTVDYFVGPKDISQTPDGTVYILTNNWGKPSVSRNYLYTFRNKVMSRRPIPNTPPQTSMYADDDIIVTMSNTRLNYSCDGGNNWTEVNHRAAYAPEFDFTFEGQSYDVENYGEVHIMDTSAETNKIDAFIAPRYYVGPPNKAIALRIDADYRHKVVNIRIDTSQYCY